MHSSETLVGPKIRKSYHYENPRRWFDEGDPHQWHPYRSLAEVDDRLDEIAALDSAPPDIGIHARRMEKLFSPLRDSGGSPNPHKPLSRDENVRELARTSRQFNTFAVQTRINTYLDYAKTRGLPDYHIKAVIKELGGDEVKQAILDDANLEKARLRGGEEKRQVEEMQTIAKRLARATTIREDKAERFAKKETEKETRRAAIRAARRERQQQRKTRRKDDRHNNLHSHDYEQTWRYET